MHRHELVSMFRSLASEIAEKDFSHISEDTAIADLGMDSLAMLELVGSMERELKIKIPDEELSDVKSVRQLLEKVEKQVARTAAA